MYAYMSFREPFKPHETKNNCIMNLQIIFAHFFIQEIIKIVKYFISISTADAIVIHIYPPCR